MSILLMLDDRKKRYYCDVFGEQIRAGQHKKQK